MIFESMERAYEVIRLFEKKDGYDNYLCRCIGKNYILCCIWQEEIKQACCGLLLDIWQKGHFQNMVEVFCQGDYLIAVFEEHPLQRELNEYVKDGGENYLFMSRMEFMYQILCALCIQEIPVEIACDLFQSGRIGLKSDGNADGYYHLISLEHYEEYDIGKLCGILADELEKVFGWEFRRKNYKELRAFCEGLRSKPFEDVLQIVSEFSQLYQVFQKKYEDGILTQSIGVHALLDKAKGAMGFLKKALVILIIVCAFGFLLWSLRDTTKHSGGIYQEIGDLTIREYVGDGE